MLKSQLPWREPLDLATAVHASGEACWALLYSAVRTGYSGQYSYLACGLSERIEADSFAPLAAKLSRNKAPLDNAWFGYLGYELKDSLEALPPAPAGWLRLPPLCMLRFARIYQFDHDTKTLTLWADNASPALPAPPATSLAAWRVASLTSNMTRQEYLDKAAHVIERIHAGDLYQANLTRKFMGHFESAPDPFALFRRLSAISPAPYSAFLKLGNACILSSSPELFLRIDAQGRVCARPIKGTAPRFADAARDEASRAALAESSKDRAENLMIADLMRNDLSRGCAPGSVTVESLFDITTHATIHHMSSTVTGQLRSGGSTLEAVAQCFPPGSMTGAPKIRAMQLCGELEAMQRGVYSGALGWLGGDGSCEFSVVIRTLLVQGERFEFQVGGGIVADSTPQRELQELIDKSAGILRTLGLSARDVEGI